MEFLKQIGNRIIFLLNQVKEFLLEKFDYLQRINREKDKKFEERKLEFLKRKAEHEQRRAENRKKEQEERAEFLRKAAEWRKTASEAKKKQREAKMQADIENEFFNEEQSELQGTLRKILHFLVNSLDVIVDIFFVLGMEVVLFTNKWSIISKIDEFLSNNFDFHVIKEPFYFIFAMFLFFFITEKSLVLSVLCKKYKLTSFLLAVITILCSLISIQIVYYEHDSYITLVPAVLFSIIPLFFFQVSLGIRDKAIFTKLISGFVGVALVNIIYVCLPKIIEQSLI